MSDRILIIGSSGQIAAGYSGQETAPRWRSRGPTARCTSCIRHQSKARDRGQRGEVPEGSLLSTQCRRSRPTFFVRPARGHSDSARALHA